MNYQIYLLDFVLVRKEYDFVLGHGKGIWGCPAIGEYFTRGEVKDRIEGRFLNEVEFTSLGDRPWFFNNP
ncbi:hypothetical protein SAMN05192533_105118 [Mesobacillus persicus]|uniref:Uncharacterized protein n=1 Tax=Mesobacillus persicus TaxID=930146 RepID=A0A1H8AT76_9BACI|nr:hypothetical protein SAMN05192533_105118 [Mesobacillus persicus]